MLMNNILSIIDYVNKYRYTKNIFKKIYYKYTIYKSRNKIKYHIDSSNLYDLLLEFCIIFYNIKDIQEENSFRIYNYEDNNLYSIYICYNDIKYGAKLQSKDENRIEFSVIPKNIKEDHYYGTIYYDSKYNENDHIINYNLISRMIIYNSIDKFINNIIKEKVK